MIPRLTLAEAQAWLTEHTFACEYAGPQGVFDLWACVQDNRVPPTDPQDLTVYRVELYAVGEGVHRVTATIDESANASPTDDRARGFFASTIAGMIPEIAQLDEFVLDHLTAGGTAEMGTVTVVLSGSNVSRRLDLTAR